ncbi:hypothetical protein [Hymenobacter sp.]|uniref:hypothetical protein n=1 Tax=Hymenobacter sp. TaxID=1898978 RepID=UPI00286AEF1A|nr:hypothetical protein [Hymenobacter sp.]
MKTFVFVALLMLTLGPVCTATAQVVAPAAGEQVAYPGAVAMPRSVPDSVQQAVHKLFKWGRRMSIVSGAGGSFLLGSSLTYPAIGLGATGVASGILGMVRFSRRRERRILAALERGQPLPPYLNRMLLVAR